MASAPTKIASTKGTTNYARLCRLLVDVGAQALRDAFDRIHPQAGLHEVLKRPPVHPTLRCLRKKRILNLTQWGKLYPTIPSSLSSANFDITLLVLLLKNTCGLSPPTSGWNSLPPAEDTSIEANIARVLCYRNELYSHGNQAFVDDQTFSSYWVEISNALVELGSEKSNYGAIINQLKTEDMDPDIEGHYQELLKEWKKEDNSITELKVEFGGGSKEVDASKQLETLLTSAEHHAKIRDDCKQVNTSKQLETLLMLTAEHQVETGDDHKQVETGKAGNTSVQSEALLKTSTAGHQAKIGDDHKQVESCETGNSSEQSETFLKMLAAEHQVGMRDDCKQVKACSEKGNSNEPPDSFLKAWTADHQAEIGDDHKQVESCEPGNTREQSETFLKTSAAEHQVVIRDDRKQVESGKPGNTSEQSETLLKASTVDHEVLVMTAEQIFGDLKQMQHAGKIISLSNLSEEMKKIASDKGFRISDNEASGNCMFYALSEQLDLVKGIQISHEALRQHIVQFLMENPTLQDGTELFNFVDGHQSWPDYLRNMATDGTWGDHIILHAAANCFKTCIHVISSLSHDLTIRPEFDVASRSQLVLGHLHEHHYVSLQPKPDQIGDDHKQVESCEKGNTSEQPETFLKALTTDCQGTKIEDISEYCNSKPPRLCFKFPKMRNLPKTSIAWSKVQLPIDVLLVTVEDCEFLSCYFYLDEPFKTYHKDIGPIYFGAMGSGDQEKLKIALKKCIKRSEVPGGPLPDVINASRVLQPKAVISVGTCHGLNSENIKIGDILVSSKLTTPAFRTPVSRNFGKLIRHASDGWEAPLENPDEWQVQVHCDADVLSEEGEDIFAAAHDGKMEWLLVEGVASDRGLSQSVGDDWKSFASTMAASLVANILCDPYVFQGWPHCNQDTTDYNLEQMKPKEENMTDKTYKNEDDFDPAEVIDQLRGLYGSREGCLALFPWCEGEFNFRLSDIFTRLRMVSREKTRGSVTDKMVEMSGIFQPHEECQNPKKVLIEGDPGMGKTTYCNKLAYDWASMEPEARDCFPNFKMVLLLRCRDMTSDSNLRGYICEQILPADVDEEVKEDFFKWIKHHQSAVLVVLDGLDEIPKQRWSQVEPIIQGRSAIFSQCHLVVTARHEAGIKARKSCDTLLEIVGFTKSAACEFVEKYFKTKGKGEKMAQTLSNRLEKDKSLQELIANPLNTALLCLVVECSDGILPEKKTTLYMDIVEYVLTRYTEKKNLKLETGQNPTKVFEQQLKHLGSIALKGLFQQTMYFEKHQLGSHENDLPSFGFLSLQHGRNRRRPCLYYAFLHKSFQEHFAAFYLCTQLMNEEMSPEDLAADKRYFSEMKQVLLFTSGILTEASEEKAMALIQSLAAHIDEGEKFFVAVECIKECKKEGSNFHLDLARTFGKSLKLQSVNAWGRNLGYVECDIIAKMLTENTTVTYLNLRDNKLGSECVDKICDMLHHNNTLTELNLSWNKLGSECADKICDMLNHNNTLTDLDLSDNKLGSECADKICDMLHHNNTLTHLNLSRNELGSECADKICDMLHHNNTLTHLDLSWNELGSEGADKICDMLHHNNTLAHLYLSYNELGSECVDKICDMLYHNNTLTSLDLRGNQLDSECADKICDTLYHNNTLTYLDLSWNNLGSECADKICDMLHHNNTLSHLDLCGNNISDPVCKKLEEAHGDHILI